MTISTNSRRVPTLYEGAILLFPKEGGYEGHAHCDGLIHRLQLLLKPTNRSTVYSLKGSAVEGANTSTLSGDVFAQMDDEKTARAVKPMPVLSGFIQSSINPDQRLRFAAWQRKAASGVTYLFGKIGPDNWQVSGTGEGDSKSSSAVFRSTADIIPLHPGHR